jgi:acetoin utilization deacetylase AcuC-like enzyme
MIVFHDPDCVNYHRSGDPERPARIANTAPLLKQRYPAWKWRRPSAATDKQLLRAHTVEHLQRLADPEGDFDVDTPAHENIDVFARSAAGAAIAAAQAALAGDKAFSLMRPPGHHATRDRAMGFCYFSSIAVAALDVVDTGVARVAIWDFDAHHGNGTEDIVCDKEQIAFASIHQSPGYPGTGLRSFNRVYNFPVPPYTARITHMQQCEKALELLLAFHPQLLLVSAGFDGYVDDPITQMTLELDDFGKLGQRLAKLDIPIACILEGGYSHELPQLIDVFLSEWAGNGTGS